jgi:hypothetical protein
MLKATLCDSVPRSGRSGNTLGDASRIDALPDRQLSIPRAKGVLHDAGGFNEMRAVTAVAKAFLP